MSILLEDVLSDRVHILKASFTVYVYLCYHVVSTIFHYCSNKMCAASFQSKKISVT